MSAPESALSPTKRAIVEIRELRARLEAAERSRREPIAVIGIGCRFPGGVDGPDAFWRFLCERGDGIAEIPGDRWDLATYYDPDPDAPGKMYARHGGFLDAVDRFDAAFFGISPREAASMDPQQRLLLEVSWEALEHAAHAPDTLSGTATGVYVGMANSDYGRMVWSDVAGIDAYAASGSSFSVAAGRLSYLLGLRGPSLAVDTACSSALVAVHLAVQALRAGECRLALAGGVNLILTAEGHVNFCRARMLARDGRCKTFDARADGYVRGEGCGVVVLKRLADAVADGDRVLAVIRGAAVNQDGRSSGLTVPNGPAQQAVIRAALANAGLEPAAVRYVEAHGTGTALGDPIEVQALAEVLGDGRPSEQPLLIGSVKTNIGHLEAAAGVAGLIKAVLALHHGAIPASLHFEVPNPHVAWAELPVRVVSELAPWPSGAEARVAGVSAFGFAGTNAHVVLEAAPAPEPRLAAPERPRHVLALSAASEAALREMATRWSATLAGQTDATLPDVCHTAAVGRAALGERLAVVAAGADEARSALEAFGREGESPAVLRGRVAGPAAPPVAFLFTGQGAQYPGMGRALYDSQPIVRQVIDRCAEIVDPGIERPLRSVLFGGDGHDAALHETAYTQPALFAVEYALAALWRAWGLEPTFVLGHSLGELVAATVAGVYSLEDALGLVSARGRLMQTMPAGAMASVWASEAMVSPVIAPFGEALAVAAVNGPEHVVIAGESRALDAALRRLEGAGVGARRLPGSRAFHTPAVDVVLDELEHAAAGIAYREPHLGLVSNVTGELAGPEVVTPAYWRRQARASVRFAAGVATLWRQGVRIFVEVGPTPTLLGMASRCVPQGEGVWIPSLRPGRDDWTVLLEAVARVHLQGVRIDWKAFDCGYPRRRVSMPTYPFQRSRHWIERRSDAVPDDGGWSAVVAAGERQSTEGPLDLALSTYGAKWRSLETMTVAAIAAALVDLGCLARPAEPRTVDSIVEAGGIEPKYRDLFRRWLDRLTTAGLLEREGETYATRGGLSREPLETARRDAEAALADVRPLFDYVDRCATQLAAVVTGRLSALETLFPAGNLDTAQFLYSSWAVARYSAAIARTVVNAWRRTRPDTAPVRVLEVGAGTGSMTHALLPSLPRERTIYWYTDVSPFFLAQAERVFHAYTGMRYGVLDVERDPREQGYGSHAFDVVVAANVLHATADLKSTLERLGSLLAPDGLLVILETTRDLAFFDISLALIEGWRQFADPWRHDTPLLTADRWLDLLRACGFVDVAAFPHAGGATDVLPQTVLVARRGRAEAEAVVAPTAPSSMARSAGANGEAPDLRPRLDEVAPVEREAILTDLVRRHVAHVLRLGADRLLDARARLMDLGIDSLMAVELRTRLSLELARPLPATLVFDCPTVEAIVGFLMRELDTDASSRTPGGAESRRDAATAEASTAQIEALSEEAAEQLLLKKLERLL